MLNGIINKRSLWQLFLWWIFLLLSVETLQAAVTRNMFMLTNINVDDGLSSDRVYSIFEAPDGAMWISTKQGVDRYNGRQVTNYLLATDKPFSDASGGKNIKLTTDNHCQLFAYDNKGKIYRYDKAQDIFILQINLSDSLGIEGLVLNELVIDEKGGYWMAMDKGVYLMCPDGKGRYILKERPCNHLRFVNQRLVIGSAEGCYTYPLSDDLWGKEALSACPQQLFSHSSVLSSYHDKANHQLWLGTFRQGILVVDDRTWEPLPVPPSLCELPLLPIRSILPYDEHTVMIAVDGAGVYSYDRPMRQLSLFLNTEGRPGNVLQGNGIYALCRDRLGDLWVGSYTGGVDLAIPMNQSFTIIRHEYLNHQSLIDNNVNAILQNRDSQLWYATDKGVSIYDEATQQWHHGLYGKVALALCQLPDDRILVGTYGHGVYQINSDGSAIQLYSLANGIIKTDYVYSLLADSEGGLWIGCLDGDMAYISPSAGTKAVYLPINEVQCITESPDKQCIDVGTSHGCYRIDRRTHRINRFHHPSEYPGTDQNLFVNAMVYEDAQHVWIGTDGGGLYQYDLASHRFQQFTTQHSLPSNNVYALLRLPNGDVWISTDKGLACLHEGKVVNLNIFKGLEREYECAAATRTQDDRLIFGSSNGAIILTAGIADGLNYNAPLHIWDIKIDGRMPGKPRDIRHYTMIQDGKLHLSHKENTFVVSFESINYQYQHDIEYQYYLEGFDSRWSPLSQTQQVRFDHLPPGQYLLHLKAIGRCNRRLLGETCLDIQIDQPWWNTWWAWGIYLCLLATMAYIGWDYYRERLQRKYYGEKINIFVNMAHNIRTPLSLVLAPLSELSKDQTLSEKGRDYLEVAQRNGNNLLRMINELLDFQKIDQSRAHTHQQLVNMADLLHQQTDKFLVMANEKHITLRIAKVTCPCLHTDRSMMNLIFENLLSNAIKYTPEGGEVTLSALSDDNKVARICVSDTGIGIPKDDKKHIFKSFFRASNAVNSQEMGSGLGLMLTRMLVQRLGGTLTFESEEGKGTTFTLTLPLTGGPATPSVPAAVTSVSPKHTADCASEHDLDHQKDTLLFVDDNADLRHYIRMVFSDSYHVIDVENGDAALTYLHENGECDIVVSDVMMPGMQGDELCRRIKEDKNLYWLPVVLLTAKAERHYMIEGLNMGADDYVAKPFDPTILAGKINSLLKNRQRMSQFFLEKALSQVRKEQHSVAEAHTIPQSDTLPYNPDDQAFVEKATQQVLDNLSDPDFGIDQLCREMAMSRTLFYGRLKTLTGQSPQDFIRFIRLEQAAIYIRKGDNVLDVSIKTGFVNVKHFSTVFKKHFGVPPSKYSKEN